VPTCKRAPPSDLIMRNRDFFKRVEITSTCWVWKGTILRGGYGQIKVNGKKHLAHRFFYELLIGPIPNGLTLDHLCRVRACVRPGHLEPVTSRENTLRGTNPPAQNARKTHCKRGHPLSGSNLYVRPRGGRICRACSRGEYYRNRGRRYPLRKSRYSQSPKNRSFL
jgi:hypothetical protein